MNNKSNEQLDGQKLTFEEWNEERRRLMVEKYSFPPNKPDSFYGSNESYREAYDNGDSPDDALIEDWGYGD